jgi:hypothetical protein
MKAKGAVSSGSFNQLGTLQGMDLLAAISEKGAALGHSRSFVRQPTADRWGQVS